MRITTQSEPITYEALERTLKPLGFSKREVASENAIIFSHDTSDASIILPLRSKTDFVSPLDFNTVRKTVVEKGVATPLRFQSLARRARVVRKRPTMIQVK